MVVAKEIKKIFQQLLHDSIAQISVGGSDITIKIYDNATKFLLTTDVYFGGNFIPKSVRTCIAKQPPFLKETSIKTYLSVDEKEFRIFLNFIGVLDGVSGEKFRILLEEFSWIADEWRLYLDENDKNDLIHIHIKR